MQAIFFLIPLALVFCALIIKAFFWAVSHRQFENLDSAAHSILFDEDERSGVNAQCPQTTRSPQHPQSSQNTQSSQENSGAKE